MRLYGRNPVLERIKTAPRTIRRAFVQEGHRDLRYVRRKLADVGVPVRVVPATKMAKMARSVHTQGLLLEVEDYAYIPFPDAVGWAVRKGAVVLLLDGVMDPQNLGAILRTCAALGRFLVVLPTHRSVSVTEAVLRVACGGENHVPVSRVANLGRAVDVLKEEGFTVVGTVVDEGEALDTIAWTFPLALVLGAEDTGLRPVLRRRVDMLARVPMAHPRMALNVAQAAGLFCYEAVRQARLRSAGKPEGETE